MTSFHFGAVILAAGASTRMGEPKQLLRLDGRTLLRRTVDTVFASSAWPVVVVLGARIDAIRPEVARLPVLVVENGEWKEGLASSIRAGVGVLETFSFLLEAALLVACDQPNLSAEAVARLISVYRQGGPSIVTARYEGHSGPPALFGRSHFHELMGLRGSEGARPLFARHADQLATVDLPELATDLDTPEDLHKFLATSPALKKPSGD
ncbi:MAG TPA: nucleotidyltransferase family protein [Opitutaceae bacterium]|nr:nucleotidyltransferase family protein [Opitutaceae bacterium]